MPRWRKRSCAIKIVSTINRPRRFIGVRAASAMPILSALSHGGGRIAKMPSAVVPRDRALMPPQDRSRQKSHPAGVLRAGPEGVDPFALGSGDPPLREDNR
jgi:hypothetical protein